MTAAESPWRNAGLLFGRMFEDVEIEASVFPAGARVFCIASAGCTAIDLANRGHEVTAVDVNPAQIALVRERLAGGPSRAGSVDRMIAQGRRGLRVVGWTEAMLRTFLLLDEPIEQRDFWRTKLDTWRFRAALGSLLSPVTLGLFYPAPLVGAIPPGFARIIRRRLERAFSTHPNRTNPYAWSMLLGTWAPPPPAPPAGAVTVVEADAVEYLESCPTGSFDAFSLSNIGDGAGAAYVARLGAAVARAATPGAVIVDRSFAEPENAEEEKLARRDRAMLWGRVRVSST